MAQKADEHRCEQDRGRGGKVPPVMKVYNFAQFRRRPFRVSFAKFGPQGTLDPSLVPQDLSAPRNFRGNLVTLSVRYAF